MGILTSLFSAVAILLVGSGLLGVLSPIRTQIDGFPTVAIGALGTAYCSASVASATEQPPRVIARSARWLLAPLIQINAVV